MRLDNEILAENTTKGISVIVGTCKGEKYILSTIKSLEDQTLDKKLFEIIIVINGEKDKTELILKEYIRNNSIDNIKIEYIEIPSLGYARNFAVKNIATKEFVTFIDDDDYISKNYLEEMYKYGEENKIVIAQVADFIDGQEINYNTPLNNQIRSFSGIVNNPYKKLYMAITLSACKLIPIEIAKDIEFDISLKSGEDVVYYTEIISKKNIEFLVIPSEENAIYYRRVRENSMSRKDLSYDFNVTQRLAVIKRLNELLKETNNEEKITFIKQKINAQTLFINKLLISDSSYANRVRDDIYNYNLEYIPFSYVNKGLAKRLIISYCFPPYVDASGNVMAKRIREGNEIVDIVYNNMSKIRERDVRLNKLTEDLIENRIEIPSNSSFANFRTIKEFCDKGMEEIKKIENQKGAYESIYSRAMFPASHFLAFYYKVHNPKAKWTAEFSDPVYLGIDGNERSSPINDPQFIDFISKYINEKQLLMVSNNNLFFWCEYLAYLFADELVFTNENQLKWMSENFPVKEVKELIIRKSTIRKHPTLSQRFYNIVQSNYKLKYSTVNFAYFGSFYEKRNLDEIFIAFSELNSKYNGKYSIHLFTSDVEGLNKQLENNQIYSNIVIKPYISFLEFLNLTTKFDCLIVNDSKIENGNTINPYLPSKISDYMGSGKDIWALCDPNSSMSKYNIRFKSIIGNFKEIKSTLEEILEEKIKEKSTNILSISKSEHLSYINPTVEKLEQNLYRIKLNSNLVDMEYAWYIFKDDTKVETIWYKKDDGIRYRFNEKGVYKIQYFIRDKNGNKVMGDIKSNIIIN